MTLRFHAGPQTFAEIEVLEITDDWKRFQATDGKST
jgi:hypothetical protein